MVVVSLQYYRIEPDGSETDIPLPDNYPDQINIETDSVSHITDQMVMAIVLADLKACRVSYSTGLGVKWFAQSEGARN